MNPFDLDVTGLVVWGLVAHLIADWIFQTDFMAQNKMKRRAPRTVTRNGYGPPWFRYRSLIVSDLPEDLRWWDRHPAAYVHAGIHGVLLALVFGWVSLPLAITHLLIDTRVPVAWLSKRIGQIQPVSNRIGDGKGDPIELYDLGSAVRMQVDQVWHIAMIAGAALLVTL